MSINTLSLDKNSNDRDQLTADRIGNLCYLRENRETSNTALLVESCEPDGSLACLIETFQFEGHDSQAYK